MSISLLSNTLNESENLVKMLDNVKHVIDEWVIVDTGSTDGTQELGRSLGARVIEFPSLYVLGGYGKMRTYSLHQCKSDYALIMDGDERFLPDALDELKRFADSPFYDLVWLPRINYTDWDMKTWDNPLGHFDFQPKFVRVKESIYWIRPVHELIQGITNEYRSPEGPTIRHFGAMKTTERIKQVAGLCSYAAINEPYPLDIVPIVTYWQEGRRGLA